jgi:hypothetical protein
MTGGSATKKAQVSLLQLKNCTAAMQLFKQMDACKYFRKMRFFMPRDIPDALSGCAGYIQELAAEPCCSHRGESRRHFKIETTGIPIECSVKSAGNPGAFFCLAIPVHT